MNQTWGLTISLFLFFAGLQLVELKQQNRFNFQDREYTFSGIIWEQPQEKENSVKTLIKLKYIKDSTGNLKENNSLILCYLQKDTLSQNLKYGDQILAHAILNEIKNSGNPYAFNYKKYLSFQQIYSQCYIESTNFKITDRNKGSQIRLISHKTRQKLLSIYERNNISGDEFGVLSALTLGYKAGLTPELKESFSTSGAMHVLAVSGLHVGIIFIILSRLLFFLQKRKYGKIFQSAIIIVMLFFYAFLTGLSDSVLRASLMFTFISIGQMFSRQVNIYNSIFASAFILLIINPYSIMNVGFQLSYAAVLSIVFFQPKIYSLFNIRVRIADYLWQLISVAFAAQIGTFPITIHYFNQFPLYFILSNIIIIPLATIIIYGAILLFIFSFLNTVSFYIATILNFITRILNSSVSFIEDLPMSKLDNILIDQVEVFILLLLILIISFFLISKKLQYLKYSLVIALIFFIYNIGLFHYKRQQCLLTVHNASKMCCINLIAQNKALLLSDNNLTLTDKNISYNILPLWKEFEIHNSKISFKQLDKPVNYLKFKDKRIVQLQSDTLESILPGEKIKCDYVILSKNVHIDINTLSQFFNFKKVIFDSSNSYYKTRDWENECKENKIAYHNVLESGAFVQYL